MSRKCALQQWNSPDRPAIVAQSSGSIQKILTSQQRPAFIGLP
jgi:hypothetical protein